MGFQPLVQVVAQEFVESAQSLIDNLALTRRDALINNFAPAPLLLLSFVLNNLTETTWSMLRFFF